VIWGFRNKQRSAVESAPKINDLSTHSFDLLQAMDAESIVVTATDQVRSEEHTSELQSHHDLVCRLLLEKKKNHLPQTINTQSST